MKLAQISTNDIQRASEQIAQELWPGLKLTKNEDLDRTGIDALLRGQTVQIKGDQYMAKSKIFYHELYEKTRGRNTQLWRPSGHQAQLYISVTFGFAIKVPTNILAEAEIGLPLRNINGTSLGFLVPIKKIRSYEEIEHDLWPWKETQTPVKDQHPQPLFDTSEYTKRREH